MSPVRGEPEHGLPVSRLYVSRDQGWGTLVASQARDDWPPPGWLPLTWTAKSEGRRAAPDEDVAKAS